MLYMTGHKTILYTLSDFGIYFVYHASHARQERLSTTCASKLLIWHEFSCNSYANVKKNTTTSMFRSLDCDLSTGLSLPEYCI